MRYRIDTRAFDSMVTSLARELRADRSAVLKTEVGKVLERAVSLTPAMQVGKLQARNRNQRFSARSASFYQPKYPRSGRKSPVKYYLKNRYPDALWQALQAGRARDLGKRLRARGWAKFSWVMIAMKLGQVIQVPAYVTRAVPTPGKRFWEDVDTISGRNEIAFSNSQPTINAIGGARILEQAIDGRIKFFIANLRTNVFGSLTDTAKKYPGVTVRPEEFKVA